MDMGPTSDGSGSTRRLVIAIDDIDSAANELLHDIDCQFDGKVWKGYLWNDRRNCFKLYIAEYDIDGHTVLTEGMHYNFEIIGTEIFGEGLTWKQPHKYTWKRGMNIRLKCKAATCM